MASLAPDPDGWLRRFGLHRRPRLRFLSAPDSGRSHADVAQLVEHHLAKVRVAGSNPVVRSERVSPIPRGEQCSPVHSEERGFSGWSGREARQRTANPCTRVQIPSPPRAIGAAVARFPDTEEVTGSNPVSPTTKRPSQNAISKRLALGSCPMRAQRDGALEARCRQALLLASSRAALAVGHRPGRVQRRRLGPQLAPGSNDHLGDFSDHLRTRPTACHRSDRPPHQQPRAGPLSACQCLRYTPPRACDPLQGTQTAARPEGRAAVASSAGVRSPSLDRRADHNRRSCRRSHPTGSYTPARTRTRLRGGRAACRRGRRGNRPCTPR